MKIKLPLILGIFLFYNLILFGQESLPQDGGEGQFPPERPKIEEEFPSVINKGPELQSISDTKGELSVSAMGSASYVLPIALPPGIKNVAPQIALSYNSSSDNGMAGYGWNITGISSISRIASRLDLDGYACGVKLNAEDKFSLDGQRLILKSGVYGEEGAQYQTENYSHLKIESRGSIAIPGTSAKQPETFTVTFPDGTQVFYGSSADSRGITEWLIKKWKDPQGNFIEYFYQKDKNTTYISKIIWGGNEKVTTGYANEIHFYYKARIRVESAYVAGIKIVNSRILDRIEVNTGAQLFKKYQLNHETITGNYQRLTSIQEYNANNEAANPIVFTFHNTTNSFFTKYEYKRSNTLPDLGNITLTGDFDGDGLVDVVAKGSFYKNLFETLGSNKIPLALSGGSLVNVPINTVTHKKINSFHSLVTQRDVAPSGVQPNDYAYQKNNKLELSVFDYNQTTNNFKHNYTRKITYPFRNYSYDECVEAIRGWDTSYYEGSAEKKFLVGDFNGDGISEFVILGQISISGNRIVENNISPRRFNDHFERIPQCEFEISYHNITTYYVDMNPEVSDASSYKSISPKFYYSTDNIVADIDGDGKSDIISFNGTSRYGRPGEFKVSSLDKNRNFTVIFQGEFPEYDGVKPLLMGDLNGDGKTDFMIPEREGSHTWFAYLSTGKGFEKVRYDNFREYKPYWKGAPSANRIKRKRYHLEDLNKDGKADFIESEYESWTVKPKDRDGRGYIRYFENLGGAERPVFGQMIESVIRSDYGYNTPIQLIIADYSKNEKSGNYVFVQGDEIWRGKFNKDLRKDLLLTGVSEAGGNVTKYVEYSSLESNAANNGLGDANGVYFSSNQEPYPYKEISRISNMDVVKKISVHAAGKTLFQEFKYFGLTSHIRGLGILGFKKTARSNWRAADPLAQAEVWSVEEMYPRLGRTGEKQSPLVSSWTFKGNNYSLITHPVENQLLNKKSVRFTSQLFSSGVLSNLPDYQQEKDFITGITVTSENQYDTYNNLSRSTVHNGVSTIQTDYTYANNPEGKDTNYYIGRLTQKNISNSAYSDTFTAEEKYVYTGNQLTQVQTKGHNTDYKTETFEYDTFGNLINKTISLPGEISRSLKDQYDSHGRFVIHKTDAEGLEEFLTYNTLGQVISHTDPLGVKTETEYDHWGSLKKVTLTGASETPLVTTTTYERTLAGGLKTTVSDNTGNWSSVLKDVYGREIKTMTKGFSAKSYIYKNTEYDALGRKIKESEPYFSGNSPKYWNTVEYDELSRPIKQKQFTGKEIKYNYNGLSITTDDGVRKHTLTKDAEGNTVKLDDNGQIITYAYYANGKLKTSDYGGHIITLKYDGWGNKIYLHDPAVSPKPYTYTYNSYGEVLTETTPNGTTAYTYSPTGRILTEKTQGENTDTDKTYEYSAKGILLSEKGTSNGKEFATLYTYDQRYKLSSVVEQQPKGRVVKTYDYDALGRTNTESVAAQFNQAKSSVDFSYHYNAYNGILEKITDKAIGNALWEQTAANERMQTTNARLGNGVTVNNTIDGAGFITGISHTGKLSAPLALTYNFDWKRGTLTSRSNHYYNWNEQFTYDSFDRLVSWSDPDGVNSNSYQPDGRIADNSEVGKYNYNLQARYKKSDIELNDAGKNYYSLKPTQQITYNAFKNPVAITEGKNTVHFEYSIQNTRSGALMTEENGKQIEKLYASGYTVEYVQENFLGKESEKILIFIGGDPYTAPVLYQQEYKNGAATASGYYYLHRDYQGTIMAISNPQGQVVERRLFDPWGKVLKVTDKEGKTDSVNPKFTFIDRGYTGHEHLEAVGLIHMNGRIYDPVLKQFLSPDNFVQEPFNSQNYNRYGYVLNNPLMYTDPSGEIFGLSAVVSAAIIGAFIGGTTYTAYALYTDTFSWSGFAKSMVMGGVSGVTAYGIGQFAALVSPSSSLGQAGIQAISHAYTQGFIYGVSGGDVLDGFSSGGISSLAASAVGLGGGALGINGSKTFGTLFFGTISGGFGSVLTGGNFWYGSATGLIVSGLNHVMHSENEPPGKKKKASTESWDLDGDGRLSLSEANNWYRNGNGEAITVDASKIDISPIYKGDLKSGESKYVNFASPQYANFETGLVYGTIKLTMLDGGNVMLGNKKGLLDIYDFDYQPGRLGRNIATWIGEKVAGKGMKYEIYVKGTVKLIDNPKNVEPNRKPNKFWNFK